MNAALRRLDIEDFGLIARASVTFSDGFTVFSGETGSGKTMLLGALAFVLGERSSADVVRSEAERARVTLDFEPDAEMRARLDAAGFPIDDDESAHFSREMSAAGKSAARINGRAATAAQVREFGEALADRLGQHEQQRLLSHVYQLDALDRFAGDDALSSRAAVREAYERATELEREIAERAAQAGRARAELDDARFALDAIDAATPTLGEDDLVRERRDYLANVERIATALGSAHEALAGDGGALERAGAAASSLAFIERFSTELSELAKRATALQSETHDLSVDLARELDRAEFDPAELEVATARLDVLERLKRKYGGSIAAVMSARAEFARTIETVETRDERDAELRASLAAARAELDAHAERLSAARERAARELEGRIAAELSALAMPAARFAVVLERANAIGPNGRERADFRLAPNPGEPPRSLGKAASGGELSRVLLALAVVLADRRDRTALVFDEIDAGIGGATAAAVGARLGRLAATAQVTCVTHLAQIAAWADAHYALRKRDLGGTTRIDLVALADANARLEELARMLSGATSGVALEHAQTLLGEVRARKSGTAKLSA